MNRLLTAWVVFCILTVTLILGWMAQSSNAGELLEQAKAARRAEFLKQLALDEAHDVIEFGKMKDTLLLGKDADGAFYTEDQLEKANRYFTNEGFRVRISRIYIVPGAHLLVYIPGDK